MTLAKIQQYLFAILLFLIPTNLFLKFKIPSAFVNGTLVDYLLPKFYLSDIFILALLVIWIIDSRFWKNLKTYAKPIHAISMLIGFLGLHSLLQIHSPSLPTTLWFGIKILEMVLFAGWVTTHKSLVFSKFSLSALMTAVIFQTCIGIFQYNTQHSIFGYWFLGEPNIRIASNIAKSEGPGSVQILPYGTTAHPNVLAGFMVFAMSVFLLARKKKVMFPRWTTLVFFLCSVITIYLSESSSAQLAFLAVLFSPLLKSHAKKLALVILITIPVLLFFGTWNNHSFLRRQQLQSIALNMIRSIPITGGGLGQFTAYGERFGAVPTTTRFYQPVHHTVLLWISETGVIGIAFSILFFLIVQKMYAVKMEVFSVVIISISLLLSLDHYMFSVQTGMLIATIWIALFLEKRIEKVNSTKKSSVNL